MSKALINPQILQWAVARKGIDRTVVESFNKKYHEWEAGESLPTFKQSKELAKKLKIPFGYLFLSEPPEEKQHLADLRTISDFEHQSYSPDLLAVIEDAIRKQDWYREHLLIEQAEPLPFVGRYNVKSKVHSVANDIIETLSIGIEQRQGDLLRFITEQCEDMGILVLRNGKVGANTHRLLDVEEFRGFVLSDSYAPLIFINSADYKTAQIFTLIHEVTHIWIGQEGVSNVALDDTSSHSDVEKFCNQVAAQVLVPGDILKTEWGQVSGNLEERCEHFQSIFHVSKIVLARRALDLKLTGRDEFFSYHQKLATIWKQQKKTQPCGGSFYNSFPVANSTTFTNAVCHAVYSGEMLFRNGAHLLGVKTATLHKYAKQGDMA